MGAFSVRILASAAAELLSLPFPLRRQVNQRINSLKLEPRPAVAEHLGGGRYRLRIHDRKILYILDETAAFVRVFAIR